MSGQAEESKLTLTFLGDGFKNGEVPVTVVAAKLLSLQNVVFHAAAAVDHFRGSRRGPWTNRYRKSAELAFRDAHHSDLTIDASLARTDGGLFDLGTKAVDLVFKVAGAVAANNPSELESLNIGRDDRGFLVRGIESICPNTTDDYTMVLSNGMAGHAPVRFNAETRRLARSLAVPAVLAPEFAEEATIMGYLTKIHVDVAPAKIAVQVSNREIECFYNESMRDQIANLLAGSMVEVTGLASLDVEGRVTQLDSITDVETVGMDPLRITRFEHDGRRYKLREPLLVAVEYADGMWVYHDPDVNLWGYGERREDAVHDLHANFDYIYREFAEEQDARLDEKALDIKHRLNQIVELESMGA
ncbi:MAG: hypothetical protein IT443_12330 [Phycisphaeraceae bacterium]|nr:hypothetical protein [Phycisphaeraceae bacterium]